MSNCIFCATVDNDIPDRIIHETDQSLAFLGANPLVSGHTLVVPREHHTRLDEALADAMADLFAAMNDLVSCVEAAIDADVTDVGINNGPTVSQEVDHVYVHIVPRFEDDGGSPTHAVTSECSGLPDEKPADIEMAISG